MKKPRFHRRTFQSIDLLTTPLTHLPSLHSGLTSHPIFILFTHYATSFFCPLGPWTCSMFSDLHMCRQAFWLFPNAGIAIPTLPSSLPGASSGEEAWTKCRGQLEVPYWAAWPRASHKASQTLLSLSGLKTRQWTKEAAVGQTLLLTLWFIRLSHLTKKMKV